MGKTEKQNKTSYKKMRITYILVGVFFVLLFIMSRFWGQIEMGIAGIYMKNGAYSKAISIYSSLERYDADKKLLEAYYLLGVEQYDNGDYEAAKESLEIGIKNSDAAKKVLDIELKEIAAANIGDTVTFGRTIREGERYSIAWKVIAIEGNQVLLLMDRCPQNMAYASNATGETGGRALAWNSSDINKYLKKFGNEIFTDSERNAINTVPDKMTLLSAEEVDEYLKSTPDRLAYLVTLEAGTLDENFVSESGWTNWWLNTKGSEVGMAVVDTNGDIIYDGVDASTKCGVRPAIWVTLD